MMAGMRGPVELVGLVGPATYSRGLKYAQDGRVRITENDPPYVEGKPAAERGEGYLKGTSSGSGSNVYTENVDYRLSRSGVVTWMSGSCSCPVGVDCKHCVALLITHLNQEENQGQAGTQPSASWQATLGNIFQMPEEEMTIALAVQFTAPRQAASAPGRRSPYGMTNLGTAGMVQVRPVREGKRQPWVTTGVSWNQIGSRGLDADPRQIGALDQLRELHSISGGYGGTQWLNLAAVNSPALWPALRAIADSGVQFIEQDSWEPVTLEAEPVRALVTIREDSTGVDLLDDADGALAGGSLTIRAELEHAELPDDGSVVRLGMPLKGVAWRADGTVHLAGLEEPAAQQWQRLAVQKDGVRVPREERETFERELLPLISRVGWTSPGGTYEPKPPDDPELHLALFSDTVSSRPELFLHWSWGKDSDALKAMESGKVGSLPDVSDMMDMRDELYPMLQAIQDSRRQEAKRRRSQRLTPDPKNPRRDAVKEAELLAEVADAMKILPATVKEGEPRQESRIKGMDVVTFSEQIRPRLDQLDVVIDEVGEAREFRRADDARVSVDVGESDQRDWLDLNIVMNVGDYQVPMSELIRALTQGEDVLFLPSGEYVQLDTPELSQLRELVTEARGLTDQRRSGLRVAKVRTTWWEDLLALDVVEESQSKWLRAIHDAVTNPQDPAPIPSGLTAHLRPYQETGFQWLTNLQRAGLGGVLADDMGLGKTVQTLAMILDERQHREDKTLGPWIVVAPTSVVANWAAEARKFTPGLRVATVESTNKRRARSLAAVARNVDVLVTSYTLLRLEYEDYAALNPTGMILDEAQQAKNPASKTFTSLLKVGSPVTFAITGTPMENNLTELWAMFALVSPGLLGSAKQFREQVQKPIEKGGEHAGEHLGLLRRRIAPFLLRRTKKLVASELPEKQEQVMEVELAPGHRRLYDRQLQRERQRVLHLADDLDHNRVEVLSALTRLRQLSIDPKLVIEDSKAPSSKLDALLPLLQEASGEGHRTLVFSQFTRYLHMIAERLDAEGISYSYLDGTTPRRAKVIEGFADGNDPVFLISLKAGGVGLNLTMADYVVLTDPWWNPAVEEQAVDRTHRIGQTRNVHVYRLVSQNTIEEKVVALQDSKRQLVSGVLSSEGTGGAGVGSGESGAGRGTGESAATPGAVGGARLTSEDLRMLLE